MCTVSWLTYESGYEVLFNRDERKTRPKALPPTVRKSLHNGDEITFLAPADPQGGGSWLSVNAYGLTIGLLNNYAVETVGETTGETAGFNDKPYLSRGLLVSALAASPTWTNAIAQLQSMDLSQYRPFHILIFAPCGQVLLFDWDGHKLRRQNEPHSPVISSSYAPEKVRASRLACFQQKTVTESLTDIHRSHHPQRSAYSVCMHREDAQTVSFSHIKVSANQVAYHYIDGPPCSGTDTVSVSIDRVSLSGSRVA